MTIMWRPVKTVASYKASAALRKFLLDAGSTTVRFQKISPNFKVRVLSQGWHKPASEETKILQLPTRVRALVREVEIYLDEEIWMHCRAVFPLKTFNAKWRRLIYKLDERPLGQLLFSNPRLQRTEYELAYIPSQKIWARRSLFYLTDTKPILLTEYCMPALVKYYDGRQNPDSHHPRLQN